MLDTNTSELRLIANELVGLQFILDPINLRTIKQMEPLMYRRLRDKSKREGNLATFNYADSLEGIIMEDTFDAELGPVRQSRLVRSLMRIINGSTLRSRELTWAARTLEDRINRRLKGTGFAIHVEIGEFVWPKFEDSEKRLTFQFWKVILPKPEEALELF
jgi:hypothetical protein